MRFAAIVLLVVLCVSQAERHFAPIPLNPIVVAPKLTVADEAELIRQAALKHDVPAAFVKSIVAAESNFNPSAVSSKGAVGLMQLMPEVAQQYGVDPTIPAQNIDGGTRYLGALMKRYRKSRDSLPRTIAAYNAGPAMVDKYRGVPPFRETRTYVARVLGYMKEYQEQG